MLILKANNQEELQKYCKNAIWNCEKDPLLFDLIENEILWDAKIKNDQAIYLFANIEQNIVEIDAWRVGNKFFNDSKSIYQYKEIEYEYALLLEDLNSEINFFKKYLDKIDLNHETWNSLDIKKYGNLNISNIKYFLHLTNFIIDTFKKYLDQNKTFWMEAIILLSKYAGNFETFLHVVLI